MSVVLISSTTCFRYSATTDNELYFNV